MWPFASTCGTILHVFVFDSAGRQGALGGALMIATGVQWRDETGPVRFAALVDRLRSYGVPDGTMFQFGSITFEQAQRSQELFAREVMPAFRK